MNLAAIGLFCAALTQAPQYHVDHILIGVADLDRGIEELTKATGVKPVYGGKHPRGTHNALISLGGSTYLELIALQPGVTSSPGMDNLAKLTKPTPIGWAVSAMEMTALRSDLDRAGFATSAPNEGSRVTPAGATLHWQTAGLTTALRGAPFFIAWASGTAHPSSTSPAGCKLVSFEVASPDAKALERFVSALGLNVRVQDGVDAYALTMDCPKGRVRFDSRDK